MNTVLFPLFLILCPLLSIKYSGLPDQYPQQINHPPSVSIIQPKNQSIVEPGQQVLYEIQVVDHEDGDSRFGEIAFNEIFLTVEYYTNDSSDKIAKEGHDELLGLQLMMQNGCFTCHKSRTALVGPPLNEIASKYNQTHIELLTTSILDGSSEKWGSAPMPPQIQVTEQDARHIASWIVLNGNNPNSTVYAGSNGSFPTDPLMKKGLLVLTARYKDHGTLNDPKTSITGSDRVILNVR